MQARAVSFDFGQTLVELDELLLTAKLRRMGVTVEPDRIVRALDAAFAAYDRGFAAPSPHRPGEHAWKQFMQVLLTTAGATPSRDLSTAIDALFADQPRANLWQKPIAGMIELMLELRAHGVPVGVLSNSEGRLVELARQLGWEKHFDTIVDSGVEGVEKPAPEIFHRTAGRLGVATSELVHVGDSLSADVRGALSVGARAIWFSPEARATTALETPQAIRTSTPAGVRAALVSWGLLAAQ
ncbi:MAG: HAD-IA family hydrolase [Polyangiaceae bacterium]